MTYDCFTIFFLQLSNINTLTRPTTVHRRMYTIFNPAPFYLVSVWTAYGVEFNV